MILVLGILIGAWGIRFWWHGLAVVLGLSVILTLIGTVGVLNDPLVQTSGYNITATSIAVALLRQFMIVLIAYAIGAGGRWLVRRFKRSGPA